MTSHFLPVSTNNDDDAEDDVGGIPSLDREATFLLGTVSRFGKTCSLD